MSAGQIDFTAEGLLDGLEGEQQAERIALLEYLTGEGVPPAELRRATDSGTLIFLPAERLIGGVEERYTAAEAAERTGVGEDFLLAVRRAMGLPVPEPSEAAFTDSELESVQMVKVARAAGLTDEQILDLNRVLGRGCPRRPRRSERFR